MVETWVLVYHDNIEGREVELLAPDAPAFKSWSDAERWRMEQHLVYAQPYRLNVWGSRPESTQTQLAA
jgi:hypothetical protein